jgi:hypothetical protein
MVGAVADPAIDDAYTTPSETLSGPSAVMRLGADAKS